MTAQEDPNEDETPLDPAMERLRRKMVRLLGVSIGIMIIGLMAVFGVVVYKITHGTQKNASPQMAPQMANETLGSDVPAGVNLEGSIDIPDGAKILAASLDGNHLLVTVELAGGAQELWLYDIANARIYGRISIR